MFVVNRPIPDPGGPALHKPQELFFSCYDQPVALSFCLFLALFIARKECQLMDKLALAFLSVFVEVDNVPMR